MTTADWALGISCGSFFVSVCAFFWNVWSRFIYPKPKLKIGVSLIKAVGRGWEHVPRAVDLVVTNHGPAEVIIHNAIAKSSDVEFAEGAHILNPYTNYPTDLGGVGPFGGGLPKKLGVGEAHQIFFPVLKSWFEIDHISRIGVSDTFDRFHWVSDKQFIKLRNDILSLGEDEV